jgi:hypothetical protein
VRLLWELLEQRWRKLRLQQLLLMLRTSLRRGTIGAPSTSLQLKEPVKVVASFHSLGGTRSAYISIEFATSLRLPAGSTDNIQFALWLHGVALIAVGAHL